MKQEKTLKLQLKEKTESNSFQKFRKRLQQFSIESEGVFQPPDKPFGLPGGKLRVEPDVRSLYAFFGDVTLFLFIALAIYFGIDRWAAGQAAHQQFQMIMIGLGLITIIWIVVDRNRAHLVFPFERFPKNKFKVIIFVINIVGVVGITAVTVGIGWSTFEEVKSTFVVATWEQLIFAITLPYLIVRTIVVVFKLQNFNVWASTIATIISGIAFGFVHMYAYNMDFRIVGYLILMGIGLHSVGWYFPSLSITLHFAINMFAF